MKTMLFRTGLLACVLTAALPLAAQTFRERLQQARADQHGERLGEHARERGQQEDQHAP